jgi:hypothetical protein
MNTEEEEFNGWSTDDRTAQTYAPIKFRKPVQALFFIPFWILIGTGILKYISGQSMPTWFTITCLGFMGVAIILACAIAVTHKKPPTCFKCRQPMKLVQTAPTQSECEQRGYIVGHSGHVYVRTGGWRRADEIRTSWYTCTRCKKYVLLDPQVRIPIGVYPEAIDQREAEYKRLAKQRMEIAQSLNLQTRK